MYRTEHHLLKPSAEQKKLPKYQEEVKEKKGVVEILECEGGGKVY